MSQGIHAGGLLAGLRRAGVAGGVLVTATIPRRFLIPNAGGEAGDESGVALCLCAIPNAIFIDFTTAEIERIAAGERRGVGFGGELTAGELIDALAATPPAGLVEFNVPRWPAGLRADAVAQVEPVQFEVVVRKPAAGGVSRGRVELRTLAMETVK